MPVRRSDHWARVHPRNLRRIDRSRPGPDYPHHWQQTDRSLFVYWGSYTTGWDSGVPVNRCSFEFKGELCGDTMSGTGTDVYWSQTYTLRGTRLTAPRGPARPASGPQRDGTT